MEFRKHYQDFTKAEYDELHKRLKENTYIITKHTTRRQKEKTISNREIYDAVSHGKIIEYHFKNTNRILVRGKINEGGYNICVVLDLDNKEVVTAFINKVEDNHPTLDYGLYIPYINVINVIKNKSYISN